MNTESKETDTVTKTLSLTRWHKALERLNSSIAEKTALVEKRTKHTLFYTETKEAYSQKMVDDFCLEAMDAFDSIVNMNNDVCNIRCAIAKANNEYHISSYLSQIDSCNRSIAFCKKILSPNELLDEHQHSIEYSVFSNLKSQPSSLNVQPSSICYNIRVLDDKSKLKFSKLLEKSQRKLVELSDLLSDANRNQIEITISKDSEVGAFL